MREQDRQGATGFVAVNPIAAVILTLWTPMIMTFTRKWTRVLAPARILRSIHLSYNLIPQPRQYRLRLSSATVKRMMGRAI